jgi:hypothetical protein
MKTKQILFTITLVLLAFFIKAQDKYEFLMIEYVSNARLISISIDGKEFKKERVELEGDLKSGYNANPLLAKVKVYQDLNWEVMNFQTVVLGTGVTAETYFAYMRKKKN